MGAGVIGGAGRGVVGYWGIVMGQGLLGVLVWVGGYWGCW